MKDIFFIDLTGSKKAEVEAAFTHFMLVRRVDVRMSYFDKVAAAIIQCSNRPLHICFVIGELDTVGLNALVGALGQKNVKIDNLVIAHSNRAALVGREKLTKITQYDTVITSEIIFDYLNGLSYSKGIELDLRLLEGILVSVVEVIQKNIQKRVKPEKIKQIDPGKKESWDFTSVSTIFGDGINGSITVKADRKLIEASLTTMLGGASIKNMQNDRLYIDIVDELSNQIVGIFKSTLNKHSYQLESGWRLVTAGDGHYITHRSVGQYYRFPFVIEGMAMELELCYQSYLRDLNEDYAAVHISHDKKKIDVRVVNELVTAVSRVIKNNCGIEPVWDGSCLKKNYEVEQDGNMHVVSCVGSQGEVLLNLQCSQDVKKRLLSFNRCNENLWNDLLCEVGNQLRAAIKRNLREYSYYLENQFDVLLNAKQEIKCSYKPCGKAFCLNFSLEGYPFTLLIDINSSIANSWFDISEVV